MKVCVSSYAGIERKRTAYARIRNVVYSHGRDAEAGSARTSVDEFELHGPVGPRRCFCLRDPTVSALFVLT